MNVKVPREPMRSHVPVQGDPRRCHDFHARLRRGDLQAVTRLDTTRHTVRQPVLMRQRLGDGSRARRKCLRTRQRLWRIPPWDTAWRALRDRVGLTKVMRFRRGEESDSTWGLGRLSGNAVGCRFATSRPPHRRFPL